MYMYVYTLIFSTSNEYTCIKSQKAKVKKVKRLKEEASKQALS